MLRRLLLGVCAALLAMATTLTPARAVEPIPPELRQIEAQVAAIRGLQPKQAVQSQLMTRHELQERIRNRVAPAIGASEERDVGRQLLVMLGLLDPSTDVASVMSGLRESDIAGFYEFSGKTLNVVLSGPKPSINDRLTYAHEFTHALQDQHFGLRALLRGSGENSDAGAGVLALVEGDAMLTMVLWARRHLSRTETASLDRELHQVSQEAEERPELPLVIRRTWAFPYDEGLQFVIALVQHDGFSAVDQAFVSPPTSTAEILHPDRYLNGHGPVDVALPDIASALGNGWREVRRDTLGEFDIRLIFEQYGDESAAARASTGWAGDQYALLVNPGREYLLADQSVWDDEREAIEFFDTFLESLVARYGDAAHLSRGQERSATVRTPDGAVVLQLDGAVVTVAMGPTVEATTAAADAVATPVDTTEEAIPEAA